MIYYDILFIYLKKICIDLFIYCFVLFCFVLFIIINIYLFIYSFIYLFKFIYLYWPAYSNSIHSLLKSSCLQVVFVQPWNLWKWRNSYGSTLAKNRCRLWMT